MLYVPSIPDVSEKCIKSRNQTFLKEFSAKTSAFCSSHHHVYCAMKIIDVNKISNPSLFPSMGGGGGGGKEIQNICEEEKNKVFVFVLKKENSGSDRKMDRTLKKKVFFFQLFFKLCNFYYLIMALKFPPLVENFASKVCEELFINDVMQIFYSFWNYSSFAYNNILFYKKVRDLFYFYKINLHQSMTLSNFG